MNYGHQLKDGGLLNVKHLSMKERIAEAKQWASKCREVRKQMLAERYRDVEDTEAEEERYRRIMNDYSAWTRIG